MSGSFFKFDVPRGKEAALLDVFKTGNFREVSVPYALAAVETPTCRVTLYAKERHGCRTLTVQGRGADEFARGVAEMKIGSPLPHQRGAKSRCGQSA